MSYIISLVLGYAVGCFQTSYILARSVKNIDIREHGSGNAGSTNALRVMGAKFGIMTFGGDLLKAIIAVVIARAVFDSQLVGLFAGLGVVLGHNWPVILKFKGGKGIASTLGVMLAYDWRIGLIVWAITAVVILTTKYVSVGSMLLVALFPIGIVIFHPGHNGELAIAIFLMVMGIFRHRANIQRLLSGTENKIGKKKAEKAKGLKG